jgi:polar amino acid transport system substrate-binding protein
VRLFSYSFAKIASAVFVVLLCFIAVFSLSSCSADSGEKPTLEKSSLTTPTISQDGVLKVGVNADKSPLAGMGDNSIIGIDVDIAAAIADELGLSLSIVDVGSSPDQALKDGTVDMVLGIDSADSYTGLWVSDSYIQTGIVLFAQSGTSAASATLTADSNPKVAAQVSSKSAWAVSNIFGSASLTSASDLASAFSDLKNATVSYVAADAVVGDYAAHRQNMDVSIVALLDSASGYCAATLSANTTLRSAVANALATIKANGVVDVIQKKWLGNAIDLTNVEKLTSATSTTNLPSEDTSDSESSADVETETDAE